MAAATVIIMLICQSYINHKTAVTEDTVCSRGCAAGCDKTTMVRILMGANCVKVRCIICMTDNTAADVVQVVLTGVAVDTIVPQRTITDQIGMTLCTVAVGSITMGINGNEQVTGMACRTSCCCADAAVITGVMSSLKILSIGRMTEGARAVYPNIMPCCTAVVVNPCYQGTVGRYDVMAPGTGTLMGVQILDFVTIMTADTDG